MVKSKTRKPINPRSAEALAQKGLTVIKLEVSSESLDSLDGIRQQLPGYKEMHPRKFLKTVINELGSHPQIEGIIKALLGVK